MENDRLLTDEEMENAEEVLEIECAPCQPCNLTYSGAIANAQDRKTLRAVGRWLKTIPRVYSVDAPLLGFSCSATTGYGFASVIPDAEIEMLLQGKMPGDLEPEEMLRGDFMDGLRQGLADRREGKVRSWSEIKKELGLDD